MNLPEGHFLQGEKYRLTGTIGQGGFGITYLGVWNTEVKGELGAIKTEAPICIKEYFFKDYCYRDKNTFEVKVHSQTGERLFNKFKEKLIREAQILSDVHHPYIVNVLEVFEENNTAYIVMEYIKGCSLKFMLEKEGTLPENKALKYIHQIGNALIFVHEKNILHLDIKPGNILIDKENNAKLIDFGVSKRYDIDEKESSTTTLSLSKGFAPIEQYDNEGTQTFSPCPDIYSLGATLYNLLTGIVPIESILRAAKQLVPPSTYNANISPKTEKAILKAMEIKPENRFQSVKEMLADLDIPPYEFDENNLTEEHKSDDDDDTEGLEVVTMRKAKFVPIISGDASEADSSSNSGSGNDESTEFRTGNTGRPGHPVLRSRRKAERERKRKLKRRRMMIAAIAAVAVIGLAAVNFFSDNKIINSILSFAGRPYIDTLTSTHKIETPPYNSIENKNSNDTISVHNPEIEIIIPTNNDKKEDKTAKINEQLTTNTNKNGQQTDKPATVNKTPFSSETPNSSATTETLETIEKEYNNLITNAKAKLEEKKYSEAKEELLKANRIKPSDEIINLIEKCNEEAEKIAIAEKLKQYDIYDKVASGSNITVARNKTTKLFGAIDAKGDEIIPCKYKNTDKHDIGRLFLRTDNNYDLYDSNGKLLKVVDAASLQ